MTISSVTDLRKRRLERLFWIFMLGFALFYAIVCTSVYILTATDVTVSDTIFPTVWDAFQNLLTFAFYWGSFSMLLCFLLRFGPSGTLQIVCGYVASAFLRSILSVLVGSILLQNWDNFTEDLIYAVLDGVFDLLFLGIVFLIGYLLAWKGKTKQDLQGFIPFKKLFAFSNPFLFVIFLSGSIPSVYRLISRIIYDVNFGPAQNLVDLLWMIFFYLCDLAGILVGYFVMFLLIDFLIKTEERKRDNHVPTL